MDILELMSTAISVKGVSKRYRIGLVESDSKTFAGQLVNMIKTPFTNLKKLRSLSSFKEEDESIFWALKDISFEVQEGEVLGIIGHNGAGKSTLLKILSRITEPTSGEITIRGRVSSLLEVGTGFHPDLTGRDNIYMNGTILGMKKKEIDFKLEEIIEFSGVSKYIDTPVKRYSSGMKVRLAFSVAAHLEPEVLIIDEVLAVGDAEFQRKCMGKMEDVADQGRTVLFVSHNLAAVESLCSRTMVLDKGTLLYAGENTNAISKYLISLDISSRKSLESGILKAAEVRSNGLASDLVLNGNDLIFSLKLFTGFPRYNIIIRLQVIDQLGEIMFTLNNYHIGKSIDLVIGENIIEFHVKRNQLIEGSYKLKLLVQDAKTKKKIFSDEIIKSFSVQSGDFFGSGKLPAGRNSGKFLVNHSIRIL